MGRRAATLASGRRVAELGACAITGDTAGGQCRFLSAAEASHGGGAGHARTLESTSSEGENERTLRAESARFLPALEVSARRTRALRRARCPPTRSSRTGPRAARRRCVCQRARHPMRRLHRPAPAKYTFFIEPAQTRIGDDACTPTPTTTRTHHTQRRRGPARGPWPPTKSTARGLPRPRASRGAFGATGAWAGAPARPSPRARGSRCGASACP